MDPQRRQELLAVAFEEKAGVLGPLEGVLDADLPLGHRSLARVVQLLGFLPFNVWLSEVKPEPWRDRELQEMAAKLAAALLNVIDWVRERAELQALGDPSSVIDEMELHREEVFDGQRRDVERAKLAGIAPQKEPGTLEWEGWRDDEWPRWRWLAHTGVYLGAGGLDLVAGSLGPGSRADKLLYVPLELALDMIDWLEGR
jgi:hypothetical protein